MIELSGSIYLYMGYGTNIEGIWLQPLYILALMELYSFLENKNKYEDSFLYS